MLVSPVDEDADTDEDDSDVPCSTDRESAARAANVRNFVDARTALMAVCACASRCQRRETDSHVLYLHTTHLPPLPVILPQANADIVRRLSILSVFHEPRMLDSLVCRDPLGWVYGET